MIANIKCLIQACTALSVPFSFVDKNHNVVCIEKGQKYYFANASTPLNSEDVEIICRDKEFSYNILKKVITTPLTKGYFDPARIEFKEYREFENIETITEDITKNFIFPVIIKRNRGSQGMNVFFCRTTEEIHTALGKIYDTHSKGYDYVALAQTFIDIKEEFRVIVLKGLVVLIYKKDISQAQFTGNISPLAWDNARTVLIEDKGFQSEVQDFIAPIFKELSLNWGGLDIARDRDGKLHLIELNSRPGFDYYIHNNGEKKIVDIYTKILMELP